MQAHHEDIAAQRLNLDDLSIKALIDWQEFEVTLERPSQFRHLQARTAAAWGKVHFAEVPGSGSRSWIFRLQNPPGPDQFMREVQAMTKAGDSAVSEQDVRILCTEIAVDVYHVAHDRAALIQVVLHLLRHQARPLTGLPRITGKETCSVPLYPMEVLTSLREGRTTIRTGPMGADHTCRFYLKDYDTVNGVPYAALPPDQWRARFENTLRADALPFKTIQEWRNFRFETLSKDLFAQVMPSPARSPLVASMQARMLQLGRRPDSCKRRPSDRRKRGANTRRDSALNDKIRQALRALTTAQSCRNSVKATPTPICVPLENIRATLRTPEYIHIPTVSVSNGEIDPLAKSPMTSWHPDVIWVEQRGPPCLLYVDDQLNDQR